MHVPRKRSLTRLALALAACALPLAGAAQTTPAPAADDAGVMAGSGATVPDASTMLEGIESGDFASALGDLAAASTIHVASVEDVEGADADALGAAAAEPGAGLAELRAAIAAHEGAAAALEAEGASAEDVVWLASEAEGQVTLYTLARD
jgi:hypothetical protein